MEAILADVRESEEMNHELYVYNPAICIYYAFQFWQPEHFIKLIR